MSRKKKEQQNPEMVSEDDFEWLMNFAAEYDFAEKGGSSPAHEIFIKVLERNKLTLIHHNILSNGGYEEIMIKLQDKSMTKNDWQEFAEAMKPKHDKAVLKALFEKGAPINIELDPDSFSDTESSQGSSSEDSIDFTRRPSWTNDKLKTTKIDYAKIKSQVKEDLLDKQGKLNKLEKLHSVAQRKANPLEKTIRKRIKMLKVKIKIDEKKLEKIDEREQRQKSSLTYKA